MKIGRNPSTQMNLREMLALHDQCVVSLEEDLARLVASMHLLASIPNGLLLEFDQNPNALRAELLQEPISAADGFVKMPERPGLGVALDPVVVER